MATAKKTTPVPASKKTVKAAAPAKAPALLKPIKTAFNKTGLIAHVAELAAVEPKAAKAVLAALEATMLASIHKKGLGEFTLPGLLKITAQNVPAVELYRSLGFKVTRTVYKAVEEELAY